MIVYEQNLVCWVGRRPGEDGHIDNRGGDDAILASQNVDKLGVKSARMCKYYYGQFDQQNVDSNLLLGVTVLYEPFIVLLNEPIYILLRFLFKQAFRPCRKPLIKCDTLNINWKHFIISISKLHLLKYFESTLLVWTAL